MKVYIQIMLSKSVTKVSLIIIENHTNHTVVPIKI